MCSYKRTIYFLNIFTHFCFETPSFNLNTYFRLLSLPNIYTPHFLRLPGKLYKLQREQSTRAAFSDCIFNISLASATETKTKTPETPQLKEKGFQTGVAKQKVNTAHTRISFDPARSCPVGPFPIFQLTRGKQRENQKRAKKSF